MQGPTGRGFESFTGSYLWALDSYTKFVFGPTAPYGIDWVKEFENGKLAQFEQISIESDGFRPQFT